MRVWNAAYVCSCIYQFVFMHNPYSSSICNSLITVFVCRSKLRLVDELVLLRII